MRAVIVGSFALALLPACNKSGEQVCFELGGIGDGTSNQRFCGMQRFTYPWPDERDGLRSLETTICGLDATTPECNVGPCDVDELEEMFVETLRNSEGENAEIRRCYGENIEEFQPVCEEQLESLNLEDSYPDACCWSAVIWADCPPLPAGTP